MNQHALNFLAAAAAGAGIFFMAGSAGGLFRRSGGMGKLRRGRVFAAEGVDSEETLAARLAKGISDALPFRRNEPAAVRISRAGYPFRGLAEYYQRKFVMMLFFAAAGLAAGLLLGMRAELTLPAAAALGCVGFFAPDSELRDRLRKRRRQMRREMAFMLDRVAFAVMAYGTFQEALARMSQMEETEDVQSSASAQQSVLKPGRSEAPDERARMVALGSTVSGMGGGLFAEYLNRMASLLLGSAGVQFASIRQQLGMYYPSSPELQNFLDIVEAGLHGTPMVERLLELTDAMIVEMEQEQREAGMKATSVVVLAAGAVLVPLLLVVGGPALFLAISVFGG